MPRHHRLPIYPRLCPPTTTTHLVFAPHPTGCSCISQTTINASTCFLSAVGHPSKLVKPMEEVVGTPFQSWLVKNVGDNLLLVIGV